MAAIGWKVHGSCGADDTTEKVVHVAGEAPRAAGFPPFSSLERSPLVLPPFYAPDFARLRSTTSGIRYTLSGLVRSVLVASSVEDGRTAMIPSDVNVECTTWLQARLAHAKRIL